MKYFIYYHKIKKGFVLDPDANTIGVTKEEYTKLLDEQSLGKEIVNENEFVVSKTISRDLESIERSWRNSELQQADMELNKVQDSDPKAIGSVSDWRNYRKLLRAWPENVNFPNKEFRPVSPGV